MPQDTTVQETDKQQVADGAGGGENDEVTDSELDGILESENQADDAIAKVDKAENKPPKELKAPPTTKKAGNSGADRADAHEGEKAVAQAEEEKEAEEKRKAEATQKAEDVAKTRQEAEDRKLVAEQAEKLRKEQESREDDGGSAATQLFNTEEIAKEIASTTVPDVDDDGRQVDLSIEDWDKNYPGIAGRINAALGAMAKRIESRFGGLEQSESLRQFESRRNEVFDKLASEEYGNHTDAADIVNSDEYLEWVATQSDGVRALADDFDPGAQSLMLNAYKAAMGIEGEAAGRGQTDEEQKAAKKRQESRKAKTDKVGSTTMRSKPIKTDQEAKDISDADADKFLKDAAESA